MKIYMLLFYEFFKIGLFSVGGGYATLPFLYFLTTKYNWFSAKELTDMLAVSNVTPGPVGINMATFAGFASAGILGSIVSTMAIVLPSYILILIIVRLLKKFQDSEVIGGIFEGLRPAGTAMIAAIGIRLFFDNIMHTSNYNHINFANTDIKALLLFAAFIFIAAKTKRNPILFILLGGIMGIILHII